MNNFIDQLKQSGLRGRSGSNFPVWQKWQAVKNTHSSKKYVVCNGSEGEPMIFKDKYILQNYLKEVMLGITIALKEIGAQGAYIYLKKEYYQQLKKNILPLIENLPIEIFEKPEGYLCGEETALINAIEGKEPFPKIKPPYPTEKGLWGNPTLIHNVETFYCIAKIAQNQYRHTKFFCVNGDVPHPGVFELPEQATIEKILKQTENLPSFDFFVQASGWASGEILLPHELRQPLNGLASIIVFNAQKHQATQMLEKLLDFFSRENCDRCTPCREGIYRLSEIAQKLVSNKIPHTQYQTIEDILQALKYSSLCPLGKTAAVSLGSYLKKLFVYDN